MASAVRCDNKMSGKKKTTTTTSRAAGLDCDQCDDVVLCRWMFLDDQNLCIQTSSSFVYDAVPIGGSIYVVGDLDTGQWNANLMNWRLGSNFEINHLSALPVLGTQVPVLTTSASSVAARGPGIVPSPCYPATFPKQPALHFGSPTVVCSAFS